MSFGNEGLIGVPGDFSLGKEVEVTAFSQKWNLELINFPNEEGGHSYGSPVKIGILDTGYSAEEGLPVPHLIGQAGFNNSNDEHGHGTHVFGITSSIAKNAQYYIVRVLGADMLGTISQVITGLYILIDKEVDVINISIGTTSFSKPLHDAIKEANEKGIIVVAASGNSGRVEKFYPAAYPEVIGVGSVNRFKMLATTSTRSEELDCVAPGVDILSYWPGGKKKLSSGTSMAAPHVTGIVALIIDHYKTEHGKNPTIKEVKKTLYGNAEDLGLRGWDEKTGNGLAKVQFHKKKKDKKAVPPLYIQAGIRIAVWGLKWYLKKKVNGKTEIR